VRDGFGHPAADARSMQRTVVAEEVQPCIVDCFDGEDIEDGCGEAGKGMLKAADAVAAVDVVAAVKVAAVAVGDVQVQDPDVAAVETGPAEAAEAESERAVAAVLVRVDYERCRTERERKGSDSFYGRKK